MRNNNQEIAALLARESYNSNKSRNRILTAAVALTVMMLFGVFSLAVGKLETDILLYMRNSGTAASTTLERGSKEQQEEIEALPYIRAVGSSVYIGNTEDYSCEVLDETGWEKMTAPAYSDIHGEYPQKTDEIMLPVRAMEAIGIHEPELGMEIPAGINLPGGEKLEKTFILSGYYTDYLNPAIFRPAGYFSQEFLQRLSIDTAENTTLLIQQKDNIDDEAIEDMLYRDVEMRDDSQQFFGGISIYRQVVYDLAGGFDTAVLMAGLILFGAAMLLYNVMYISLSRDIRQYGLLKTMGTTKRQLRSIVAAENHGHHQKAVEIYCSPSDRQDPGWRLCGWRGSRNSDHCNGNPPAPYRNVSAGEGRSFCNDRLPPLDPGPGRCFRGTCDLVKFSLGHEPGSKDVAGGSGKIYRPERTASGKSRDP